MPAGIKGPKGLPLAVEPQYAHARPVRLRRAQRDGMITDDGHGFPADTPGCRSYRAGASRRATPTGKRPRGQSMAACPLQPKSCRHDDAQRYHPLALAAPATYLYALDLDGPALAWEYLRRHPGYRAAGSVLLAIGARPWRYPGACDVDLDPRVDAREAHPVWIGAEDRCLTCALRRYAAPRARARSSLWRIRGRKHLACGIRSIFPHWTAGNLGPACLQLAEGSACRLTAARRRRRGGRRRAAGLAR